MVRLNFEKLKGSYDNIDKTLEIIETTDLKEYLNEYGHGSGYEVFKKFRHEKNDGYDPDVSYMAMIIFSVIEGWDIEQQPANPKKYQLCDRQGRIYRGDTFIGPASFLAPLFYENVSGFLTKYPEHSGNRYSNKKLPDILSDLASQESVFTESEEIKCEVEKLLHLVHSIGNVVLYPLDKTIDQGDSLNSLKGTYKNDSGYDYLEKVRALLIKSRRSDGSVLEERIVKHYEGISWEKYVQANFLSPFIDEQGEVKELLNLKNPTKENLEAVIEMIITRGRLILAAYQTKQA